MTKLEENGETFYLFPLAKKFGSEKTSYIDATYALNQAIDSDLKRGYSREYGPAWGIECVRARDYADYVSENATLADLSEFNTEKYTLVTNALTDEQMVKFSNANL